MSNSSMNPKLAKTIHFYRIVLHQTQKIELPKRFASIYGNELSNIVTLIAPSGREWHVELMKCGAEIWLSNGWKDFADYFGLKYGNLLIFKYEGHSRFYVFMIFDQTTCEIEYPIDINISSKNGNHDAEELETPRVEEIESDDSVEIMENISRSRNIKEESFFRRFSTRKRTRSTASIVMQGDEDVKKPEFRMTKRYGSKISPKEVGGGTSAAWLSSTKEEPSLPRFSTRKRTRATASIVMQGDEDVKKPEFRMTKRCGSQISPKEVGGSTSAAGLSSTSSRANCFGSENLSFVVNVRKTHIKGGYVHIPIKLVRNSWPRNEAKVVVLKDQDGETWPVHLVVEKRKYVALGCGWMAFARSKDLQVGDSCAFELFKEPEISFRVAIFRNSEDSNDRHTDGRFEESMQNKTVTGQAVQRISSEGTARSLERVREPGSVHPFFKVVVTANYLQARYPNIPISFCDEIFERLPADVTLEFKGKSWPLRIIYCVDRRGRLSSGWHAFASENKLKVGDVCVFEMIKKTNIVFKVSISRAGSSLGENSDNAGRFGESMQNKTVTGQAVQRISNEGTARSLERVSEIGSVHPFFKVVVTANFLQACYPNIPFSFCDENIKRLPADVTLEFLGKSWPLRIVYCVDRRGRLSHGWHAFASENKLRVGDVCVFEMIKKTNIVFKVSIFRDGSSLGANRC